MLNGREITNYEKGLLTGVAIGAALGPSFTLIIFCLIVCYDLGRPQIIEVSQRAFTRVLGINEEVSRKMTDNLDVETVNRLVRFAQTLTSQGDGDKLKKDEEKMLVESKEDIEEG